MTITDARLAEIEATWCQPDVAAASDIAALVAALRRERVVMKEAIPALQMAWRNLDPADPDVDLRVIERAIDALADAAQQEGKNT